MDKRLAIREIDFASLPRDPTAWVEVFRDKAGTVFFDSAMAGGALGRWSFLAIDPITRIRAKSGRVWADGREIGGDPFATLRELLAPFVLEDRPELPPFACGIAGYFGYDLKRHVENVPEHRLDDVAMPDLAAGLFDLVLAVDHRERRAYWLAHQSGGNDPESRIRWAIDRLQNAKQTGPRGQWSVEPKPDLGREHVQGLIQRAIEHIEAGDIYQANITQRFRAILPRSLDRLALYGALRRRNPATFGAYIDFGATAILSSSPERFLQLRAGEVETRPIKGTRPRDASADKDAALARELLQSEKDRAENLMIVDLLRNDLSRVCELGSVKVPVLFGLESFATVHHLVSVVTGKLKAPNDAIDLLRAAFPGGSVTGAPKIRAMEIIAELEPTWRGPYCGAVGYLSATGAMDTSIAIRTMCVQDETLTFQVGGGIVADSDPEAEFEEAMLKAKALIEVLRRGDEDSGQKGCAA